MEWFLFPVPMNWTVWFQTPGFWFMNTAAMVLCFSATSDLLLMWFLFWTQQSDFIISLTEKTFLQCKKAEVLCFLSQYLSLSSSFLSQLSLTLFLMTGYRNPSICICQRLALSLFFISRMQSFRFCRSGLFLFGHRKTFWWCRFLLRLRKGLAFSEHLNKLDKGNGVGLYQ